MVIIENLYLYNTPIYCTVNASQYLKIPVNTLRSWIRSYLIKPSNPLAADKVLEKFNAAQEFGIGVVNQHPGMLTLGEYLLTLGHEICEGRPKTFGDEYEETA
ncbi:MAG: hypothetical protein ACKPA7_07095, partial [Sphaerospermopsis kisseleviana]